MPLKLDVDNNAALYLDYSKVPIKSKDDLDRILCKVPDYRTRPERLRPDELMIVEKNFFAFATKPRPKEAYDFPNPVPPSMHKVPLADIATVDINWHMLTMARPATKSEEDYFNRIVYLERTTYRTVLKEAEQARKAAAKASGKGKKGRGGGSRSPGSQKVGALVTERKHATCNECGEEFCNGTCKDYLYEIHARLPPVDDDDAEAQQQQQQPLEEAEKETKKGGGKKMKGKVRKGGKKKDAKEDDEGSKTTKKSSEKDESSVKPSPMPLRKKAATTTKKSQKKTNAKSEDSLQVAVCTIQMQENDESTTATKADLPSTKRKKTKKTTGVLRTKSPRSDKKKDPSTKE